MQGDIHFISGLPRAGSTLLSAILRQNPRFRAGMTGPVGSLVDAMLRNMSMSNETSIFITDAQRKALLRSIFSTFYAAHLIRVAGGIAPERVVLVFAPEIAGQHGL